MREVDKYIPLVDFLAQALGSNVGVVLHDLTKPDNAIIAIANNHISGREVGGSTTDLVLKILKEGLPENKNYISNYKGRLPNNNLTRSSSYFIKNSHGKIEGVLCINMDISELIRVNRFLSDFIGLPEAKSEPCTTTALSSIENTVEVFEHLHDNIDDVLQAIITKVLSEFTVPPERMSVDEKIEVVKRLNEHGLFLLKGGLPELAKRMCISETTIYRYLNKIKH